MPSVHAILRRRLLDRAGLCESDPPRYTLAGLQASEWSHRFEQLMRNRLILGALRYGALHTPKRKYDRVAGAMKRLQQYQQTGNLETLVDVANMALLEFEEGTHPKRHWSDINGDHCCV